MNNIEFGSILGNVYRTSGISEILANFSGDGWKYAVMLIIAFVLLYLAVIKKFEPLLLLPIAFGVFLANLPLANMMYDLDIVNDIPKIVAEGAKAGELHVSDLISQIGVLKVIHYGAKTTVFPCLMFLCVGAMTDFGPLISNPISLVLGAAAQFGIYIAFIIASCTGLYTAGEAASIGIIGGADGPTAIYVATKLGGTIVGPIAIAAYSYMALIPMIQPPIMRLLTTEKERKIKMTQLRKVTKAEKIVFPVFVTLICSLMLPSAASLIGMLMLGNLLRESGVTERLSDVAQNALCNIITICLGVTVGATADGPHFLELRTVVIIILGLVAFSFSTVGGLLLGKVLCIVTGGKINPLIGSAGVSAVPMAARVSQVEGAKANPTNFLLMHAMGPNVAGVIGSAVAAGFFLAVFK